MQIQIFGQYELEKHINKGKPVYSHLISIGNPGRGRKNKPDNIIPGLFKKIFISILRLDFSMQRRNRILGRCGRSGYRKNGMSGKNCEDGDALLEELEPVEE